MCEKELLKTIYGRKKKDRREDGDSYMLRRLVFFSLRQTLLR
jgi:hypothetical protein